MARTVATLPAGSRITDYISLGVIAKFFPLEKVREVLADTGHASVRERDLPAHVVVYYVIALALYMRSSYREVLRCLLEGVQWLLGPRSVKVAGKSGISQARSRLGWEPLQQLHDAARGSRSPSPGPRAPGIGSGGWSAWTAAPWTWPTRQGNEKAFGRPAPAAATARFPRSASWPWWRTARTSCWDAGWRAYATDEITLAKDVLPALRNGMLCLADRSSSATPCGSRRPAPARTCSGGSSRTRACSANSDCPMALT